MASKAMVVVGAGTEAGATCLVIRRECRLVGQHGQDGQVGWLLGVFEISSLLKFRISAK
jgi:hypothetical protein